MPPSAVRLHLQARLSSELARAADVLEGWAGRLSPRSTRHDDDPIGGGSRPHEVADGRARPAGAPPEHWVALVREHAPELLEGGGIRVTSWGADDGVEPTSAGSDPLDTDTDTGTGGPPPAIPAGDTAAAGRPPGADDRPGRGARTRPIEPAPPRAEPSTGRTRRPPRRADAVGDPRARRAEGGAERPTIGEAAVAFGRQARAALAAVIAPATLADGDVVPDRPRSAPARLRAIDGASPADALRGEHRTDADRAVDPAPAGASRAVRSPGASPSAPRPTADSTIPRRADDLPGDTTDRAAGRGRDEHGSEIRSSGRDRPSHRWDAPGSNAHSTPTPRSRRRWDRGDADDRTPGWAPDRSTSTGSAPPRRAEETGASRGGRAERPAHDRAGGDRHPTDPRDRWPSLPGQVGRMIDLRRDDRWPALPDDDLVDSSGSGDLDAADPVAGGGRERSRVAGLDRWSHLDDLDAEQRGR